MNNTILNLYALSGDIIFSTQTKNLLDKIKLFKQIIKKFKNVSRNNPKKFKFTPIENNSIILNHFEDIICSDYGYEFNIIYEDTDEFTYLVMYCNNKCLYQNHYDPIDHNDCEHCKFNNEISNAKSDLTFRMALWLPKHGYFMHPDCSDDEDLACWITRKEYHKIMAYREDCY